MAPFSEAEGTDLEATTVLSEISREAEAKSHWISTLRKRLMRLYLTSLKNETEWLLSWLCFRREKKNEGQSHRSIWPRKFFDHELVSVSMYVYLQIIYVHKGNCYGNCKTSIKGMKEKEKIECLLFSFVSHQVASYFGHLKLTPAAMRQKWL